MFGTYTDLARTMFPKVFQGKDPLMNLCGSTKYKAENFESIW